MKALTKKYIKSLIKPREVSSHKGTYGHALIVAGSKGKMGASVIAARACMRAGSGLLTVNVPQEERYILQISAPETMLVMRETFENDYSIFSSVGIGPGLGINRTSKAILNTIISTCKNPILLDADALNILAANKKLLSKIPIGTIITPHVKEFDRMFGLHKTTETRIQTAIKKAKELKIIIVLKGHETLITSEGQAFVNTTGNAGLAKGGSGDALTGIITSLLAQSYTPFNAAKIGVYLHGLAADIALKKQSMESMLITDVIECLGKAFKKIENA